MMKSVGSFPGQSIARRARCCARNMPCVEVWRWLKSLAPRPLPGRRRASTARCSQAGLRRRCAGTIVESNSNAQRADEHLALDDLRRTGSAAPPGSQLALPDCSQAGVRAHRLAYWAGRPPQLVAGGASERPGRGRGAVQGGAREHTARHRAVATMASAPRAPRPARPHSPGLVVQGLVGAEKGVAATRRGPRSPGGPCLTLPCCPPTTGAAARSGLGGRAGLGTRGAAPVLRGHRPVACVRVPSPERRHGLGLATTQLERGGL